MDDKRKQLGIRLDDERLNRLGRIAQVEGKTSTEIAREGIDLVLAKYETSRAWKNKRRAWVKTQREKLDQEFLELE